jgi:hypothetical protein
MPYRPKVAFLVKTTDRCEPCGNQNKYLLFQKTVCIATSFAFTEDVSEVTDDDLSRVDSGSCNIISVWRVASTVGDGPLQTINGRGQLRGCNHLWMK